MLQARAELNKDETWLAMVYTDRYDSEVCSPKENILLVKLAALQWLELFIGAPDFARLRSELTKF
jgi:hypothetical protein